MNDNYNYNIILSYTFSFILGDAFGDGWDKAAFYVSDNKNYNMKYSPSCKSNPLLTEYCFNPNIANNGDTVTVTVSGLEPEYTWEILFQAIIANTKEVYIGGYRTSMVFTFYRKNNNNEDSLPFGISLSSSYNLYPDKTSW